MDWKILLVFILVEVSVLVVSLNEANYKHGGLQITNWPSTIPTGPQHPQRINHRHSNGGGYQEISPPPWQGTQILSQNQQHLNLPRPQIVNTIPQQYFQPIQSQIVHRQKIPQQPANNFARHHQVFNTPQAYKELPLEIRPTGRIQQQQQISSHQNVYNAATRGWTNGQELNQQNSNFGKPFNPVVGQYYTEPYANYGNNYAYGYPQAQTLVPVISNRGGRQAWLPQNQNQQVTNPVTYSQWPETSYSYAPTKDTQYINNPYAPVRDSRFIEDVSASPDQLQPGYQNANEQTVPTEQPVKVDQPINKRYIMVHNNGTYEQVDNFSFNDVHNLPKHIVAIIEVEDNIKDTENENPPDLPFDKGISQIPQDDNWTSNNRDQIGTHQTYKQAAGINTEIRDSFSHAPFSNEDIDNMVYFKPEYLMPIQSNTANDVTEHVYDTTPSNTKAIVNVEPSTDIRKNKHTMPTQSTTDTFLTTNVENTLELAPIVIIESFTGTPYRQPEQISTTTDSIVFTTDAGNSTTWTNEHTNSTTDNTLKNQMPLQSNKNNNDTHAQITPTTKEKHENISNDTNHNAEYKVPEFSKTAETDRASKNMEATETPTISVSYPDITSTTTKKHTKEGAKGALGDLNQALYDPGEKQTPLEVVPGLIEETIIKNEIIAAPVTYGDDFVIDISAYPGFLPTTNYGNEKFAPVDNTQEETIAYPIEVPDSDPAPKGETHKLRKDLETDISKLKTTVDKPIVWFRPDKNFWDKVTKGENSYDYVTFYDVNCHPQLIEKHTTVHHYPNGTEVVEYVETFWKSANGNNDVGKEFYSFAVRIMNVEAKRFERTGDLNPQEVKSNRVVRNPSE